MLQVELKHFEATFSKSPSTSSCAGMACTTTGAEISSDSPVLSRKKNAHCRCIIKSGTTKHPIPDDSSREEKIDCEIGPVDATDVDLIA